MVYVSGGSRKPGILAGRVEFENLDLRATGLELLLCMLVIICYCFAAPVA